MLSSMLGIFAGLGLVGAMGAGSSEQSDDNETPMGDASAESQQGLAGITPVEVAFAQNQQGSFPNINNDPAPSFDQNNEPNTPVPAAGQNNQSNTQDSAGGQNNQSNTPDPAGGQNSQSNTQDPADGQNNQSNTQDPAGGQDNSSSDVNIPTAPSGQNSAGESDLSQDPGSLGRMTLDLNAGKSLPASVVAGRVTTLEFGETPPASVEILSKPAYGNVTVNPDNTLALVLTDTTETSASSFDIRVTDAGGGTSVKTVALDVQPGQQALGWGTGDFYMLQTDDSDSLIVEAGEIHRKVYVSESKDALSLSDIAAREGLGNAEDVGWRGFFRENQEYGASQDLALTEEAADILWTDLSKMGASSNWLLFERGYSYDTVKLMPGNLTGESELHPIYFGAWGEGDRPELNQSINSDNKTANFVFQDLEFGSGVRVLNKDNVAFDDIVSTGVKFNIRTIDGFTLRESAIYDVYYDTPIKVTDGAWAPNGNRTSGIFMGESDGVLIEGMFFDHNGWAEGYNPNTSADDPHPPSMFSHNIYIDFNNYDVTLRDSIIMRGSSSGAQLRGGGVVEDNVFVDNNGSLFLGSGGKKLATGNYSLLDGGVVTSGGYKLTDVAQGSYASGVINQGYLATITDTIITHMADPNNAEEIALKTNAQQALKHNLTDPVHDDALVYNWQGSERSSDDAYDRNIEGLNQSILDETTIQNFTAQLLGKGDASIADLADYLRAQADGAFDDVVDADLIIDYFRTGFGLETDLRADAATLRFVPNELADGVRWDNRMNWDSNDLPGTQDGDRVELGGNWVNYGGTTTIEDLDFGPGGKLSVHQGYLQINDHISTDETGATLSIDRAGQFWTDGYTDKDLLIIDAEGGRFANTGLYTGTTDLNVSDNAEVILADDGADYVMGAGSSLSIRGGDAKVGFDGEKGDTAVLLMSEDSLLEFDAENGELGTIREFFSGHYDENGRGVQSGINLGDAALDIDVSGLGGASGAYELMRVDEIIGSFGDINIQGLDLNAQNAVLQVDYTADRVTLQIGEAGIGTGAVALETIGDANDARTASDLFDALTDGHGVYADDALDSIPAEVDDDPFVL